MIPDFGEPRRMTNWCGREDSRSTIETALDLVSSILNGRPTPNLTPNNSEGIADSNSPNHNTRYRTNQRTSNRDPTVFTCG